MSSRRSRKRARRRERRNAKQRGWRGDGKQQMGRVAHGPSGTERVVFDAPVRVPARMPCDAPVRKQQGSGGIDELIRRCAALLARGSAPD